MRERRVEGITEDRREAGRGKDRRGTMWWQKNALIAKCTVAVNRFWEHVLPRNAHINLSIQSMFRPSNDPFNNGALCPGSCKGCKNSPLTQSNMLLSHSLHYGGIKINTLTSKFHLQPSAWYQFETKRGAFSPSRQEMKFNCPGSLSASISVIWKWVWNLRKSLLQVGREALKMITSTHFIFIKSFFIIIIILHWFF